MTLLDLVIFLPLIAFLLILFLPKENEEGIRRFSLIASIVIFLASLGLISPYWFGNPGKFVFETDVPWINSPAIRYHVAIDGMVNGVGARSRGIGSILRLLQSGNIRSYAAWVVLGSVIVLLAIGFAGGR